MGSVCSTVDVKQTGSEVAGAEPNSSVYVTAYSTDNIVLGKSDPVADRKNQATPQDYAGSPPEKDMKAGDGSNPVATTKSEETRPLPEYSLIQGDISKPRLNSSIEENPGRVSTSGSGGDNKNNDNNESSGNKTEAVNATNNVVASDLVSNEAKETLPMDVDAAPEERRDPVGISDVAMTQDADNDSGLDGEDMDDHDVDGDALEFLDASLGHLDAPAKMASIGELAITKPAPDFECNAVVNGSFETVKLSSYRGKYVVLFFYPLDFTFVCPTEIIAFSDRAEEFRAANCEILACSTDSVYSHLAWIDTPRKQGGLGPMKIPLLADRTQEVSKKYGCLKPDEGVAFRGLYIIDDKGNLRQITINDLPVGRSVDETLRLVQAFQFTDKYGEVCPAGWKPGKETMKPDPKESQQFFNKVN